MSRLKNFLVAAALTVAGMANAQIANVCKGQMFNPISDVDWNNLYPITIMGFQYTSGNNTVAPLMAAMPPINECPGPFGIPYICVGVTYWQPLFISEIERRPGCMTSIGGTKILSEAYNLMSSNQTVNHANQGKESNRMQVHWFQYPIFSMMDMMKSMAGCLNNSGFDLAYITEIDPTWQNNDLGAIFSPESVLFTNPIANFACAVDAVASTVGYALDPLFWCAGTWGNVYPLVGNSNHSGDPFTMNNQIQGKFVARMHRMGLAWQTIGPTAICSSHPNPIWIKSQYRFNQVAPIQRRGRAVTTGDNGKLFQYPPLTNVPTQEHTVNLVWQGQQCCVPVFP